MPEQASYDEGGVTVHLGDCRHVLQQLSERSVQTVVTSPPYWALRDYGVEGQIGLESSVEDYIAEMVLVFGEVRRVLADDGTVWLNLGDTYAGAPGQYQGDFNERYYGRPSIDSKIAQARGYVRPRTNKNPLALQAKQMIGIPWRVALALQESGWILRQDIIWSKPTPMPESVKDRFTKSHEYVFLLAKSPRYYFDAEAVKEPVTSAPRVRGNRTPSGWDTGPGSHTELTGRYANEPREATATPEVRNKRSVWTIRSEGYADAHFATFPRKLVEPCILAGSRPGDVVLDPFAGSGTTLQVAKHLGRRAVGIELNPDYLPMIERRLAQQVLELVEVAS